VIFLTVGTQFPFDRLVRAVDSAVESGAIGEPIFGQIGDASYIPRSFEWVRSLPSDEFRAHVQQATGLVSHAGIGSILAALEARKPIVVLPRRARFGEIVNDHQVQTAERFSERRRILYALDESQVAERIQEMAHFPAPQCTSEFESLLRRVESFLRSPS
jgi:beta-1,4-N-acetylglucosaminyltransferase